MGERPADWPPPDHPLLAAALKNDEEVGDGDEGDEHAVERVLRDLDLDIAAVLHVSEQRALKVTRDPRLLSLVQAAIMDGIATGWRAAREMEEE